MRDFAKVEPCLSLTTIPMYSDLLGGVSRSNETLNIEQKLRILVSSQSNLRTTKDSYSDLDLTRVCFRKGHKTVLLLLATHDQIRRWV